MLTRDDIIIEARTWLDTPWQHQGRIKGVGVDCAGLIVKVAAAQGLSVQDRKGYPRRPRGNDLQDACEAQLIRIRPIQAQPGDVLMLAFERWPEHLALLTEPDAILHAYMPHRRVTEHSLDDWWRQHIVSAFRFPGVSS